jgi:2Fe-2S ferredoxin
MAEQKTQSAYGAATAEGPGENLVHVTFLARRQDGSSSSTTSFLTRIMAKKLSILDVALNYGVRLDHACGGNCACTTCHVWVREGAENLSQMDDDEADRLDMAADLQLNSRLGCQCSNRQARKSRGRDPVVEPQLRIGRTLGKPAVST